MLADGTLKMRLSRYNRLQREGHVMVGDGGNGAWNWLRPLAGLPSPTGTDVAIKSCDITLIFGNIRGVATVIRLSGQAFRTVVDPNIATGTQFSPVWRAPSPPVT